MGLASAQGKRNGFTQSLYVEPEAKAKATDIEWPALELIDVFKIYRSGPVETVALRGLDVKIKPREMVAVVGPSGSGKSTFLALAAALDVPSAGEIRAFGRSLARLDESELAAYRSTEIAIVFQADNLLSILSARENVALSVDLGGGGALGRPGRSLGHVRPRRSAPGSSRASSPGASSSASRSPPRPLAGRPSCLLTSPPASSTQRTRGSSSTPCASYATPTTARSWWSPIPSGSRPHATG